MCVAWNPLFRKLTSSDDNGLIIVWMLHKGMWYEEMINNRNKSIVKDMKWTADGKKICIIYEDGAVIVGSVDGNRIWGKELNLPLRFVEWSPDSKNILFVNGDADIVLYDSEGSKIKNMIVLGKEADNYDDLFITGIHWFNGFGGRGSSRAPSLCITFRNGMFQLSRGEGDARAVLIDADMAINSCKWNPSGTALCLTGSSTTSRGESTKTIHMLKLYDPSGTFLRSIRVPGDNVAVIL
jgi:WD repeat-containing protein 35